MKTERKIEILLVEDNPADARLASLALRGSELSHQLNTVGDGEAALNFLKKSGPYSDTPRPDIVILDLNLPRKNGHEVLNEMKQDEDLRDIPVVVLTVDNSPETVRQSYDAGANFYMTKPMNLDRFSILIQYVLNTFLY